MNEPVARGNAQGWAGAAKAMDGRERPISVQFYFYDNYRKQNLI
jgi:hypothetical protein